MKSIVRRVKRFRERFAYAIDLESTPGNIAQGTAVSNNSQNINNMYGSGNILYNNNPITNIFNTNGSKGVLAQISEALKARYVHQAVYDAHLSSGCMDGTRVQILRDIENWIKNPNAIPIFWLTGMAGTGKSAIAWTICSRSSADTKIVLGGSFFCSRSTGSAAQRDVRCVVPTLAQLLARQSPQFSKALADELTRNPEVLDKQVTAQIEQLLYKPLLALKDSRIPIIFVIDALDECGGQNSSNGASDDVETHRIVSEMLEALIAFSRSPVKLPVKFLVTSRPETHIRDTHVSDATFSTILRLHTVNKEQVVADIRFYISKRLSSSPQLRARFTSDDVNMLTQLCGGLFIVATTALHYALDAGVDVAAVRFRTLLNTSRDSLSAVAAAPLDRMYALILSEAVSTGGSEIDERQAVQHLLAALLSARMTLSVAALADLLGMSNFYLRASLSRLHAVVFVPDSDDEPGLRILHASFADYMYSRADNHLRIPDFLGHDILARACLRVMSERLHFNIARSRSSYERNPRTKPDDITLSLEYACLQWIYHIAARPDPSTFDEGINVSFRPRFLFWLEVVSVLGRVWRAAALLFFAASTVRLVELSRFLRDAHAFVVSSREAIERSAPHIYLSALPFAAKDSLVYRAFSPLCTGVITANAFGIDRHGARLVMTLTGHEGSVTSVAYAPDTHILASGSSDGSVRVWDTRTGEETMSPLRSGDSPIRSVAFAPNGKRLASGTEAGVVCIWRFLAGQATARLLHGHSSVVYSVTFSSDGALLASASADETIRFWGPKSGEQFSVLHGNSGKVYAVAFSPDGGTVASGSHTEMIRMWHRATGEPMGQPIHGQSQSVYSLSFSPHGTKLASSSGTDIRLWEPLTKRNIATLRGHSHWVRSVQYSPNGQSLVSASDDRSVRIWTLRDDEREISSVVLRGHTGIVRSATFSPDGLYIASASDDRTIRIWSVENDRPIVQPLAVHDDDIHSVTVSQDGAFIVSGSSDRSVRIWDTQSGVPSLPPLLGHTGDVFAVAISSDGRFIASASKDRTVRLWNAQTGVAIGEPLVGHTSDVTAVVFSPDGRWVASGSFDETVRLWNTETRRSWNVGLLRCYRRVHTVAISSDGQILAAGDFTGRIHIWQAQSGKLVREPLDADTNDIFSIAFSLSGAHIVSGGSDKVGRVWNITTGHQTLALNGHTGWLAAVAFSFDDRLIATGSNDGTVRLWDSAAGEPAAELHGHGGHVRSVAFTPDKRSVVSCSKDATIRVWNINTARELFSDGEKNAVTVISSTVLHKGWLLGPTGDLLLWVPIEYRDYLQVPPCTIVIGQRRIVIAADKNGSYCGKNWTVCWRGQSAFASLFSIV